MLQKTKGKNLILISVSKTTLRIKLDSTMCRFKSLKEFPGGSLTNCNNLELKKRARNDQIDCTATNPIFKEILPSIKFLSLPSVLHIHHPLLRIVPPDGYSAKVHSDLIKRRQMSISVGHPLATIH